MALVRALELLLIQVGFGSFYNGTSAKLILPELRKEHGQVAVDHLIRDCGLQQVFDFRTRVLRKVPQSHSTTSTTTRPATMATAFSCI